VDPKGKDLKMQLKADPVMNGIQPIRLKLKGNATPATRKSTKYQLGQAGEVARFLSE
jgi:hypothetical protein